jgi:hypothetical protein
MIKYHQSRGIRYHSEYAIGDMFICKHCCDQYGRSFLEYNIITSTAKKGRHTALYFCSYPNVHRGIHKLVVEEEQFPINGWLRIKANVTTKRV